MGKKKSFINKKQATTYNLLYRASEVQVDGEEDGPERELVDASRGVGIGRIDEAAVAAAASRSSSRYPPGHPLAWLQEPPPDDISEERRQELIQLGFPDDGYDYLKHLRAAGRGGKASLEGAQAGPSVFLPSTTQNSELEDDSRIFDASRLTLHQAAADEGSAVQASGGVTAFSRQRERLRLAEAAEVAAMEELLADLKDEEAEEEGDLEDDFIVAATQAAEDEAEQSSTSQADQAAAAAPDAVAAGRLEGRDADAASDLSSQSDWEEELEEGAGSSHMDARPGSIASTYWRPERSDRKNLLSVVDERFEHLALDYDEDDIGSLASDDPEAVGEACLDDFGSVMDDFLNKHETGVPLEGEERRIHGIAYRSATDIAKRSGGGADAEAAARTIEAAERLVREGGEVDGGRAAQAKRLVREDVEPTAAERREHTDYVERPDIVRERWDCESVLSLRSNLDNHPASISEPTSSRRPRSQLLGANLDASGSGGFIPLGHKTGIPVPSSYGGNRRGDAGARGRPPQTIEELDDEECSLSGSDGGSFVPAARRKGETAEEKKARKGSVKEAKREARAMKKQLKTVYKQETARQVKAMAAPAPATISLP